MSLKTLIDDLMPQIREGYSRSTGNRSIMRMAERGQDLLLRYDGAQMKYLGTDNKGWVPYLITTAGKYEYDITATYLTGISSLVRTIGGIDYPIRARTVVNVFIDSTNIDYGTRWFGQPYHFSWQNPYSTSLERINVVDIPVASWEATENVPAKVIFKEDPGSSTEKYFIVFTIEAPRLTSESVPLIVPEYYEEALEDYVIGKVQKQQNGIASERWHAFHTDRPGQLSWMSKFKRDMTIGAQPEDTHSVPRIC